MTRAVDTEDQRAHRERVGLERREHADRRYARGAERGQEGALGGDFDMGPRIVERGERGFELGRAGNRPARRAPRYRARPGRRTGRSRARRAGRARRRRPAASRLSRSSRSSPAIARMIASKSPAARRARRVSTLPRSATISRSGRRRSASKRRRIDDVPSRAPRGSEASEPALRASSASRGSARSGTAAIRKPEVS